MLEAAKTAHEATLRYIRTPSGQARDPAAQLFRIDRRQSDVQLVNEAQRAYAAPLAAARVDLATLPILSAAAPFKCGGRSGPYSYTDIAARPARDQGRGGHLPLPQQSESG